MQKEESDRLLDECRELMTNRMRASMSRMMGYVEDVLFEMATVDSNTTDATHYIEAVREIRMKKREIQVRFENRFMSLFRDSVRLMELENADTRSGSENMDSLFGLVFHDSDDSVTIKNTLNKARNECRLALATLDKHICILLDKEEVENFVNPMQPGTVFGAFWESCRDIHSGADIRFILVDMFERYVVADLHNVYDDLNTLFGYYNSCGERAVGQAMEECQQDTYSDVINQPGSIVVTRGSLLIRRWVENRLENRIKDKDIPDFIYRFLMGSWRKVMEGVYEKYSEDSLEWERGMVVVDDLITCTRLAHDRETRTQQIWMLPGLIYRLKNGMKTIPVPLKTQADFLSELKLYHTRVTELSRGRDIN